MKKGDSVKVKQGILDPDLNQFDMSGWQGRITDIASNNESHLIEITWDSITLKQLPKEFIENSKEEGYDYSIIFLGKDDIELTKPRDKESDVKNQMEKIDKHYHHIAFDEQERRIATILSTDDLSVTEEKQKAYFDYLQRSIQKRIILTGMEDFPWEEKYLLGGWSKKEYEELKKTNPSYTDKFEFIQLLEDIDEIYGLHAKVKRVTDKKQFVLPLWDLKCIDKNSKSYESISDYSFWMTNYR
ncbi:MAG: calcium-binding protein [Chitinophagaceae bacterium]